MSEQTFGDELRRLRAEAKLTQRELAEVLGIDHTYISKLENDKAELPPSIALIHRLAVNLHGDEGQLLCLAGQVDVDALREQARRSPHLARLLLHIAMGHVTPAQAFRWTEEAGRSAAMRRQEREP